MGTMEEKVYSRSVTKQAMSFRVVDEQQIDRHYNMAELAELYTLTKPNYAKRPMPDFPQDNILANLLLNYPDLVYKYHEHDSLLENQVEQELSEQEKADAWTLYERDLHFSSEIQDMPTFEGMSDNFPPHQVHQYFNALQGFESRNLVNFGNLVQPSASNPLLEAFSQYNFPNTSQQYLEMMSMLRKISPSAIAYPELNKPITESTFNANMYGSTKPPINATTSCNGNKDTIMSDITTSTNPLLALGDLSLYGVGSLKQNKSAFCQPNYTHSPLTSAYINSHAAILKQFEKFKPSLENDIISENHSAASLHSGRQQVQQNLSTSMASFSSITTQNTLSYSKSQQSYQQLLADVQNNSIASKKPIVNETIKDFPCTSADPAPTCISHLPNRPLSPLKTNPKWKSSHVQIKQPTSSSINNLCVSNGEKYYPISKETSASINLSLTNMGIVYPKKDGTCAALPTSKKDNEIEIISTSNEVCLPKQHNEISPRLSVTAVQPNISSIALEEKNTVKPFNKQNVVTKTSNKTAIHQSQLPNEARNQSVHTSLTEAASITNKPVQSPKFISKYNQKSQSKGSMFSINKNKHSFIHKEADFSQVKNIANKSKKLSFPVHDARSESPSQKSLPNDSKNTNSLVSSTIKPVALETQKLPIIPITSAVELKKRIDLNNSSISFGHNELCIRQVANKKNPSGGGVFIIEANVNQKKVAIGTPTKSGGGTTITKVSSQGKRKVDQNVSYEDSSENIKRIKMSKTSQQK